MTWLETLSYALHVIRSSRIATAVLRWIAGPSTEDARLDALETEVHNLETKGK